MIVQGVNQHLECMGKGLWQCARHELFSKRFGQGTVRGSCNGNGLRSFVSIIAPILPVRLPEPTKLLGKAVRRLLRELPGLYELRHGILAGKLHQIVLQLLGAVGQDGHGSNELRRNGLRCFHLCGKLHAGPLLEMILASFVPI